MRITVEYAAQVKRVAGIGSEELDLESPCTVQEVVNHAATNRGEGLRKILFDSDGALHPSILVFLGDEQVRWDQQLQLNDRDVITLLSPISGG